jgi:hypothetical protein
MGGSFSGGRALCAEKFIIMRGKIHYRMAAEKRILTLNSRLSYDPAASLNQEPLSPRSRRGSAAETGGKQGS